MSELSQAKDSRLSDAARQVTHAFSRFDLFRERDEPFDEGDMQNIHAWMGAVTRWIERADEGGAN